MRTYVYYVSMGATRVGLKCGAIREDAAGAPGNKHNSVDDPRNCQGMIVIFCYVALLDLNYALTWNIIVPCELI